MGMGETFRELWSAFRGQLADRLANPFTGAFAIAWAICNFRLLVVLFWLEPYRDKFSYIDTTLYPDFRYWLLRAVVVPAVLAFAYLLLYPRITTKAATEYRRLQSRANNEMRAAQGDALMTQDEYREKRRQLTDIQARLAAEAARIADESSSQTDLINRQRETIDDLRTKLVAAESKRLEPNGSGRASGTESQTIAKPAIASSAGLPEDGKLRLDSLVQHPPGPSKNLVLPTAPSLDGSVTNPSPIQNYSEAHGQAPKSVDLSSPTLDEVLYDTTKVQLLKQLAERSGNNDTDQLAVRIGRTQIVIMHHMEVMLDLGLVDYSRDSEDEGTWYLTKQGRAFVVKNRLVEP
jgi:DNA-binding transcriptional ArsR family regulator